MKYIVETLHNVNRIILIIYWTVWTCFVGTMFRGCNVFLRQFFLSIISRLDSQKMYLKVNKFIPKNVYSWTKFDSVRSKLKFQSKLC